jgi:Na+/proline symporter/signal transduction histidine kinase
MPAWILPLVTLAYIGLLFALAFWGDRQEGRFSARQRMVLYSLTLAVYFTSWTFYGAVGAAVQSGWSFLPIYLGPLLLILFGHRLWERLILTSKAQPVTSIADFIAARYGKAQHLAALVALFAVIGILPYIALQLKAVALSLEVMSDHGISNRFIPGDTALWTAVLLAMLAILFGTRRLDASEHHLGLMLAIGLESVVKLVALVAVGFFAFSSLPSANLDLLRDPRLQQLVRPDELPPGFLAQTLLAFTAFFCLPRQFHVSVVECDDVRHVQGARWLFGIYLVLVTLAVLPIAAAALTDPRLAGLNPDIAVLALPLAANQDILALLAFLGGFSAATGMVIVATVALSTMVSNDLVIPALWRIKSLRLGERRHIKGMLLATRRLSIIVIALLGYGCYRLINEFEQLSAIGLLAFAAMAQFAPAIIGGLFWRGGSKHGVTAGLCMGFGLWLYTLLLPALARTGGRTPDWVTQGPLGLDWLRPESLFNLSGWDSLTHGVFWSLLANISLFVLISLRNRPTLNEQIQATPFLDPYAAPSTPVEPAEWGRLPLSELQDLAARIVGEGPAQQAFQNFARNRHEHLDLRRQASSPWWQFTERLLAGAIGAPSARAMITSTLRGSGMEIGQVMSLLDQTSQLQRFNRDLLSTMMENITQGISVVDADLRLVAWNRRYMELFDYPPELIYIGCPVADLIRFNAERGECGPGDVEEHVRKRVQYMRAGSPHIFERVRSDGRVIEMRGQPIPGGGFVTTFTDVTHFKRTEQALAEAKQALELRVEQRTHELKEALKAQEAAKQQAEEANVSKTRFIAAASHDLLQPMNAARLFVTALQQSAHDASEQELVQQIDSSLRGAEELLSALLEISRLDAGALSPTITPVCLQELFDSMRSQFGALAERRGLRLRIVPTGVWVQSDRQWLRRILQNLISNALRYTRHGRVIVGVRRTGSQVRIDVWDTGPGIPPSKQKQIFEEFHRGGEASPWGEKGMGLGLATVDRMTRLLGHSVAVRSAPGHGSVFSVTMARAIPAVSTPAEGGSQIPLHPLAGLTVLCIDNEPDILAGMNALLSRWGCNVLLAAHPQEAERLLGEGGGGPDVLLADYHLGTEENGLSLLRRLAAGRPAALITADHSEELAQQVRDAGFTLLRKPVKPAALRAFLSAQGSGA